MVQLKEVEYMGREKVKQWWMAPGGGTALPSKERVVQVWEGWGVRKVGEPQVCARTLSRAHPPCA